MHAQVINKYNFKEKLMRKGLNEYFLRIHQLLADRKKCLYNYQNLGFEITCYKCHDGQYKKANFSLMERLWKM